MNKFFIFDDKSSEIDYIKDVLLRNITKISENDIESVFLPTDGPDAADTMLEQKKRLKENLTICLNKISHSNNEDNVFFLIDMSLWQSVESEEIRKVTMDGVTEFLSENSALEKSKEIHIIFITAHFLGEDLLNRAESKYLYKTVILDKPLSDKEEMKFTKSCPFYLKPCNPSKKTIHIDSGKNQWCRQNRCMIDFIEQRIIARGVNS